MKLIQWLKNLFTTKPKLKLVDPIKPAPEVTKPKWYEIAEKEIGVREIYGNKDNPKIVEYHSVTKLKATDDETPWCSSFVSWCLEKSGVTSTKNAWARSYLTWGIKIDKPKLGCIVVFARGPSSGHVAFYHSETKTHINVLGGNQGNAVNISSYKKSDFLGYRWTSQAPTPPKANN